MLCYSALKLDLLCLRTRIVLLAERRREQELFSQRRIYIEGCMNKSLHIANNVRKTVLLEHIYVRHHKYTKCSIMMTA